jgi:predicted RND superfamily exporter protein
MKRLNKNMHGDDPAWYRLPEQHNLAAQYLLLYEMSLPYGLDLNNQLNVDKSATRMVVSMHDQSSPKMIAFERRVESWLADNMPDLNVIAGSPMYMFSQIAQRTVNNMSKGVSFALILISLLLIIAFRSFKTGLISLVPNLIPPAVAFGVWGILVGEIGFSHAVAFGMTIGIIVDDTVHFLSKYLRARREKGLSSEEAVRYAFSNVGVALVITTIVLVIGFMVLATSSFKLNSDLGLITALTITIALLLDFLLLPALLMAFDSKQESIVIADIKLEPATDTPS